LTYIENKGAAFGILPGQQLFFIILTIFLIIYFIFFIKKRENSSKILKISCGLIIGGGIGNLIDRLFRGFVVDYISLSFFSPICNLADYFITLGSILLLINLLFNKK